MKTPPEFPCTYETVVRYTATSSDHVFELHQAAMNLGQQMTDPEVVCGWSLPADKADAERAHT